MRFIVLTGGPCAGKTTVVDALKQEFERSILVIPEPATMLMDKGFPAPGRDLTYSEAWQRFFQNAISAIHPNIEGAVALMAAENGARLIVCDRGLMDGAAYYPEGKQAFLERYGITEAEVFSRYTQVIHLESTAVCNPSKYGKSGNEYRYESVEGAYDLDMRIREVWKDHPNWTLIEGEKGIDSVTREVIRIVSGYIDVEIERKFVLASLPEQSLLDMADSREEIRQGYLVASDLIEWRIRQIGDEELVTIKSAGTLRRSEWESPLPEGAFDTTWPSLEGARISKVRYTFTHGQHKLELDVYHGHLQGLVTLECEFGSEDDAEALTLPDWAWALGAVEVTDDPRYKNKNLAVHGRPS